MSFYNNKDVCGSNLLIGGKVVIDNDTDVKARNIKSKSVNTGPLSASSAYIGEITAEKVTAKSIERPLAIPPESEEEQRRAKAYDKRVTAAYYHYKLGVADTETNGDTDRYLPLHFTNFTKGLPHDNNGFVNEDAWQALEHALLTQDPNDFEAIPIGYYGPNHRKLVNPQGGLCFEMYGADAWGLTLPPFPEFNSARLAAQAVELYWQALCRDVRFDQYGSDSTVAAACTDLNNMSDFDGPKITGSVTPATLFRYDIPGVMTGPFISQFLYMPCPYGATEIDMKIHAPTADQDYMTTFSDWLDQQNGKPFGSMSFNPTKRYIINGRDLAQFAHIDVLYQAYNYAMLVLMAIKAPLNPTIPYIDSVNQDCFTTFCGPFVASHMPSMADKGLNCVWRNKWFLHKALRPEAFGQRVHAKKTGSYNYPVHADVLNSNALTQVFNKFSTYLLPMAWPEGSPEHPSYGSGHATVAGACVTFLKFMFDESYVLPNCVVPNSDGSSLVAYTDEDLTVGGELNKVAWNIAIGRNFGGVHWRADAQESLLLGEKVCVEAMKDLKETFNEDFEGFRCTGFLGNIINV